MAGAGAVIEAFRAAWMARDADALAALFAEDARFVNVVGTRWRSRAEIRDAHAEALATVFRRSALVILETEVRAHGGKPADAPDWATVHARWRLTGQVGPSGGDAPVREGWMLAVCAREVGGWLIRDFQNTDIDLTRSTVHGRRQ